MSLSSRSTCIITTPTNRSIGIETDIELAEVIASVAERVLRQTSAVRASPKEPASGRVLEPKDIGVSATHRAMNAAIRAAVTPRLLAAGLTVDTPERWQGQQRPVMLIAHPLSGIEHPSGFDLETGRLCVMASRHQSALLVFARDHVSETLDSHMPSATQSPGCPDSIGGGHAIHTKFWQFHRPARIFG